MSSRVQDWIANNQGRYICACGCGEPILLTKKHCYAGVPQCKTGHAQRFKALGGRPVPTFEEIRVLYEDVGLSFNEVAARLGWSGSFIMKLAVSYGIKARSQHTTESARKLSETRKRLYQDGTLTVHPNFINGRANRVQTKEEIRKRAESNRGKKRTPQQRANLSAGVKKACQNPEVRKKYSQAVKKTWDDPVIAARRVAATLAGSFKRPTGLEKRIIGILDKHFPNEWKYVGDGQFLIGRKCPDFVHATEKWVIEAFGRYWHEPDDEPKRKNDLAEYGYRTLVLWEEATEDEVVESLRRFLLEDEFAEGKR
jgi:very-short-patch-repair endonuclease